MDFRILQFALFCLCSFFGSGTSTTSGGRRWCVVKKETSKSDIQAALNHACGDGGADCSQIQPGASCYEPNTLRHHASYAFNDIYQKNPIPSNCVFGGTATLTSNDPSNGSCHYASPHTGKSSPPPSHGGSPPSPHDGSQPSPPSSFGGSPPSSPGFAIPPRRSGESTSVFLSLSSLFACGFLVSLQLGNYI